MVDEHGRLKLKGHIHPRDGREIIVSHKPDITLVPAQSRPLTAELIELQMRKSGGTPFIIDAVTMHYSGNLFAPLAELNRARREFLTLAESALIKALHPSSEQVKDAKTRWQDRVGDYPVTSPASLTIKSPPPLCLAVYADSLDAVRIAAESGCDRVYFEPDIPVSKAALSCRHSHFLNAEIEDQIRKAVEVCHVHKIPLVWKFPRITRPSFSNAVIPLVSRISEMGIAGIMVENPGMVYAIHKLAPLTTICGSMALNVFNHATAGKLSSYVQLLTLSQELSRDECRFLISAARKQGLDTSFAIIVQGINEAIISDDCLLEPNLHCKADSGEENKKFYGIRDSTGHIFPVHIDSECRTHIGNSKELCLVDHLPEIMDMGITEVVIDARRRNGACVNEMTRIYSSAISATSTRSTDLEKQLQALKGRIKKCSTGDITTGHFIRGVKDS